MTGLLTTLGLILLDLPLFLILAGLTVALFWVNPHPGNEAFLESWLDFTNNFNMLDRALGLALQPTMVAIPFFTLAGTVMSRGAIAQRLINLADALFGWLPGGLAVSTVAACALFAAISGSSPVTVITIGAIMYPALRNRQYPDRFSLGLVTSAGSLGIIIPPSIPMIVYAIFASQAGSPVRVEELFLAGFLPGILIAGALVGYCLVVGWHFDRDAFDLSRILTAFREAGWSLVVPVVILGGIYLGVFDTTDASAIAVVLALAIEVFVHRSLEADELPDVMAETGALMGAILIIIATALGLTEYLSIHDVPDQIVAWLRSIDLHPVTFIILLDLILLVVGCLMDIVSAIILFVPLLLPIAVNLGFDPIHIGLVFIVNLEIGYLTPPIGLNLFVAAGLFGKSFSYALRSSLPFVLVILACLTLITAAPVIPLSLVNAMRPEADRIDTSFPLDPPSARAGGEGRNAEGGGENAADGSGVDVMKLVGGDGGDGGGEDGAAEGASKKPKTSMQLAAEAKASGIIGDELLDEFFTPIETVAWQEDGKIVVMMADLNLCGSPAEGAERFAVEDDTMVVRITLPADAKPGPLEVPGTAQVVFGTFTGGELSVDHEATGGKVVLDSLAKAGAEGFAGLYGVFAVAFDEDDDVQGKFLPVPCQAGDQRGVGPAR
jgi:C4-dicarboxylate transporter DctM subunit